MANVIEMLIETGRKYYPNTSTKYGFSIAKLAERLHLNERTLANWLSNKTSPTQRVQDRLMESFDLLTDEIIRKEENLLSNDPKYAADHYQDLYVEAKKELNLISDAHEKLDMKYKTMENDFLKEKVDFLKKIDSLRVEILEIKSN